MEHGGFVVVNYELVLRDLESDPRGRRLSSSSSTRPNGSRTGIPRRPASVKQLTSPHAFVLTGTPLENRLGELHSLVEFLHPRALGPRWRLTAVSMR